MGTKAYKIILFSIISLFFTCGCNCSEQNLIKDNTVLSCGNTPLAIQDKKDIANSSNGFRQYDPVTARWMATDPKAENI